MLFKTADELAVDVRFDLPTFDPVLSRFFPADIIRLPYICNLDSAPFYEEDVILYH